MAKQVSVQESLPKNQSIRLDSGSSDDTESEQPKRSKLAGTVV